MRKCKGFPVNLMVIFSTLPHENNFLLFKNFKTFSLELRPIFIYDNFTKISVLTTTVKSWGRLNMNFPPPSFNISIKSANYISELCIVLTAEASRGSFAQTNNILIFMFRIKRETFIWIIKNTHATMANLRTLKRIRIPLPYSRHKT